MDGTAVSSDSFSGAPPGKYDHGLDLVWARLTFARMASHAFVQVNSSALSFWWTVI